MAGGAGRLRAWQAAAEGMRVRAALISMAGQPRDGTGTAPLAVAGKTLARRQLDFALAAGCERVIGLGSGASSEAIALRHAAEGAGVTFQAIGDSRGLLGAVRATDELLVLAPGLLPEASEALEALNEGGAVLVLPSGAGITAGFERLDLDRAWAGAALMPGALVERLSELPPDVEAASALMRAALQARLPECRLSEMNSLAEGRWSMIGPGTEAIVGEKAWLKRHSRPLRALPSAIDDLVLDLVCKMLGAPHSVPLLFGVAAVVLTAASTVAWYGITALGFALIPLAVLVTGCAVELARLRAAPFGRIPRRLGASFGGLVDLTIVICAVFAIEGDWIHRLFSPFVLLGALYLPDGWRGDAVVRNRALLAAILAVAAGFGALEPAIMLAALGLLVVNVWRPGAKRG